MRKFIHIITLLLTTSVMVYAQDDRSEKAERIESYKIAFITERLNLTSKEAASFWPVYNEYSEQLKKIKRAEKDRVRTFRDKIQPTDAESEKYINDFLSYKQQEFDLTKKYIPEFKKVIPIAKVAKLATLEQEFKLELLHRLKDKHGPQH